MVNTSTHVRVTLLVFFEAHAMGPKYVRGIPVCRTSKLAFNFIEIGAF